MKSATPWKREREIFVPMVSVDGERNGKVEDTAEKRDPTGRIFYGQMFISEKYCDQLMMLMGYVY